MSGPAITLRLYRALADAFPQEFQNVYGDELIETAEDSIEPVWRRYGVAGLVRLVADIALRIPVEYAAELRRDIRFGLRRLAGSPGFTVVALVSLSLGICIATCAYSEMNGLLRDLPGVPQPEQLVTFQSPVSYPDYKRYRELGDLFSATFAYVAPVPFGVSLGGSTQRFWGHLVTPSYFATLGAQPLMGRFFERREEQMGATPTVVLSYRFWQEHLGADPSIVGKTLRINGSQATVIGVGTKEFLGASPTLFVSDLWLPVPVDAAMAPELAGNALGRRDLTMFQVVGRLRPGITDTAAEAELDAVAQQLAEANGEKDRENKGRRVLLVGGGRVLPIRKQDVPFFREFLMVLGGLVLLIACINTANMMLARAADRRKEIAVRLTLGASRARLIRQLLTEAVLVALGAAVPAFPLSVWLMHLVSQVKMPLPIPITYDLTLDWRALVFTMGVAALTGILFGLTPALQATRTDLTPALKEGREVQLRRFGKLSLRNALVVCQMAASLTLLMLTGYLSLGIQSTIGVQEGFNPRNLYLISLDPVRDGYTAERTADFFRKALDRVKRLPGVMAACLTDTVPVAIDGNSGVLFSSPGSSAQEVHEARRHMVGRGYFETAGIPIFAGRGFREQDEADSAAAVVVSEELVRRYWNGEEALGRRIDVRNEGASGGFGGWPGTLDFRSGVIGSERRTFEVVGVVKDVTEDVVASKKHPVIYFPLHHADYAQPSLRGMTLMMRAAPGVDILSAVRREISAMDSRLTPFNSRSMTEQIAQFMSSLRSASWTYGVIGMFGLVLASVGLAGVTAYAVAQRGHEIGIRLALGAQKRNVLGLVMKEGAALVAAGTVSGLALAWVGIRSLSRLFFTVASVQSADPVLLVGAPVLLAGVALAACYLPARKSMRIDPAMMLRQE